MEDAGLFQKDFSGREKSKLSPWETGAQRAEGRRGIQTGGRPLEGGRAFVGELFQRDIFYLPGAEKLAPRGSSAPPNIWQRRRAHPSVR